MKIKDLIGRRFYTLAQKNDVYKIEKINEFGKVVLSFNGKPTHELSYQIPSNVVELFENGTWILIEEEPKNPFYLDEYIYNNDAEKRVEAENTHKVNSEEEAVRFVENLNSAWMTPSQEIKGIIKDKCDERPIREVINQICNPPSVEGQELKTSTFKEIEFDFEIQSTIQKIQQLLLVKGKEYRRNNNPYHNFEVAARKKNITPERALDGFLLKHLVSYDDMLNDIEHGVLPKIEVVEEKFNDIICYMIIQKAQILNRINNGKS